MSHENINFYSMLYFEKKNKRIMKSDEFFID